MYFICILHLFAPHNVWNHGVWQFHFLVVYEGHVFFSADLRLGMAFKGYWLLSCHPPILVLWWHRLGNHVTTSTFMMQ